MENRLIAIGDIHGDINELDMLLDKLSLKKDDTIIFLGDYIDRGHNSKEVVNRLIKLSKRINCIFLKGNHEEMMLKAYITKNKHDIAAWFIDGGRTTYDNYNGFPCKIKKHRDFFKNLSLYYMTDKYFFVHAGIWGKKTLEEQDPYDMLWVRDSFIYHKHCFRQKIIFGHTPFDTPYVENDKIGINTGCGIYDNGYLTAFVCTENGKEKFITSKDVK